MSRQQGNPAKKSRNPKLFWLGPVPIQAAVRSFITQTLTELHILPNAQLLAELEVEVLTTTSRGGAFVFNGAHGRVSIVLRWNKAGNELFVEVKSQAPGQKTTNMTRHVFYYEDKAKMLEIKVGPVVRRLAATIGSLQKTGIPGPGDQGLHQKAIANDLSTGPGSRGICANTSARRDAIGQITKKLLRPKLHLTWVLQKSTDLVGSLLEVDFPKALYEQRF